MNARRAACAAMATAALAMALTAASASAESPPVDKLAPGYPIGNHDANGDLTRNCTAGFVVRNPRNTAIMLTAGHCDAGGAVTVNYRATGAREPVGEFDVNMYTEGDSPGPDIGAVSLKHSRVPVSADLLGRTPIAGAARPTVGQRVCKVGSYSGTTCGKVTRVTSSRVYFEAFNRYGDSGGPVYFQNDDGTVTAVGLTSAMPNGETDCQIDSTGVRDCGGTTVAELIVPWMSKWDLSF